MVQFNHRPPGREKTTTATVLPQACQSKRKCYRRCIVGSNDNVTDGSASLIKV
jgi:hypothetical protein